MNVVLSKEARLIKEQKTKDAIQKQQQLAPSINFYRSSPTFELTLDDFEVFALKRLKVSN